MNQEIKSNWINALTSGYFPQGTGETLPADGYDPWGVLWAITLAIAEIPKQRYYPPQQLLDLAGINRTDGPTNDIVLYLAGLNDNGSGFGWIAEEIEHWL